MTQFDPSDPTFLADPYPLLDALREEAAVLHDKRLNRWFVSRHADVRACLRDKRLGRNFRHVGTETEFHAEPLDERWNAFWDVERWSLLWIEPPEHTRIRKLVASAFTPRSVEALREPARQLAALCSRRFSNAANASCSAISRSPTQSAWSARCSAYLRDASDLLGWSHRMVKMYELHVSTEQAVTANDASAEFRDYVVDLLSYRRQHPADDMITRLAHATVDGEQLGDAEIVSTIVVLLNAGHEATVNTLGNGLHALTQHPGEWARLKRGEVKPAQAIEEFIRFDPPLQLFERWVLTDGVEIAGVPIPRGEKIAMLFGAANRDPRVFANATHFDIGRANASEHIGFGGGIHACIGAPLARIELEESLGAIVSKMSNIELAIQPQRNGAFVIWGLDALHLRLALKP